MFHKIKKGYRRLTLFGKVAPILLLCVAISAFSIYQYVMNPYQVMKQAVKQMDIELLEWAIEQGADVNQTIKGFTPIATAYLNDASRTDFIEKLLQSGANIDVQMLGGRYLLADAIQRNDTSMADLFSKYDANFNVPLDTLGQSVRTWVLTQKSDKLVDLVLKYSEANVLDPSGRSAIHYADYINPSRLEKIIAAGEDPSNGDINGNTALHSISNVSVINRLIEQGADVNQANHCGAPPVFHHAAHGNGIAFNKLVENGAIIDSTDSYQQTILTYAMMSDNELLSENIEDTFCKRHPQRCEKVRENMKSGAIKALATVVYTKTAHQLVLKKIAQNQLKERALKGAAAGAGRKLAGKAIGRTALKFIPFIGPVLVAVDALEIAGAIQENERIKQEYAEERNRMREEQAEMESKRKIAQDELRHQFLYCNRPLPKLTKIKGIETDSTQQVAQSDILKSSMFPDVLFRVLQQKFKQWYKQRMEQTQRPKIIYCNTATDTEVVQPPLLPDDYECYVDSPSTIYKQRADEQWESIAQQFYLCQDSVQYPIPLRQQAVSNQKKSKTRLVLNRRLFPHGCFFFDQNLLNMTLEEAKARHEKRKKDYETLKKEK